MMPARLVFETIALARDLHDGCVMQDAVKHGGRQHGVVGEGFVSAAEAEVRRQDHRALFIRAGNNLEEQVRLFAPERQIADLVDDQQLRRGDSAKAMGELRAR